MSLAPGSSAGIDVWRPSALPGAVAYRGSGVTHPYPRHWHDEHHFCLYSSGTGYLGCRGSSRLIVVGDFVITPAGEVHENWAGDENGISFRSLYLPVELFFDGARQVTEKTAVRPEFAEMISTDPEVRRSFLLLHRALEESDSTLHQEESLLEFLHLVVARCSDSHAVPPEHKTERRAVRRVREYIHEHFDEAISLAELAALADLSPYHLHRVFTLETGVPPHAYQTQLRVNRAKTLLRSGVRLPEIALATGFADQSHLTRHFRRLVGTTPGRFFAGRKNVQDESFAICHDSPATEANRSVCD